LVPDIVQVTATTHGLGGTIKPLAATETATPLMWNTIIFPNATVAAMPPDPTQTAPPIIPRALSNEERIDAIQKRANPVSVDWRNHGGLNWLTTVQDQGGCESCWVFAAIALAETQARIEHGYWGKRSEADLHDMMGVSCAQTGGPDFALDWASSKGLGLADAQCDEYQDDDHPYFPCSDRTGRSLRIPEYTKVGSVNDQKGWLANVGPLAACFNVYRDFDSFNWASNKAYKWDGTSASRGGHCILIVGYDDNIGGWLFKNSWGAGWGNKGYGYLAYVNLDLSCS
jgi:C1A family cysteine protease